MIKMMVKARKSNVYCYNHITVFVVLVVAVDMKCVEISLVLSLASCC